jgi:hypothetical protein
MKTNTFRAIASIALSAIALNAMSIQHAQAVELITNGDFSLNNLTTAEPSGLTNTGSDGIATAATATNWTFAQANVNASNESLVWLVATGTTYRTNLNILGGEGTPDSPYIHRLYGTTTVNNPVTGGSGFFIASDGDPDYSSTFSQTLTGLIAGEQYNVSFYQAAGQQVDLNGHTTEQWQVSLGGSVAQLSTNMSPSEPIGGGTATDVSPWQKESLTFTAGSTNQLISFLAMGTPVGKPPISLLTGISVTGKSSAAVPEPEDYIGTLVGMGFVGTLVRSRLAKKKLVEKD